MNEPAIPSSSASHDAEHATGHVTMLLRAWQDGDETAHEELMGVLYAKLRTLARRARRGESPGRTLATTALVNEAYVKLIGADVEWADSRHFLAVASRAMRRVLVDDARRRNRKKRSNGEGIVALGDAAEAIPSPQRPGDFLRLDEAIRELSSLDDRKGQAIELFYFGGLSYAEVARVLGVSEATVHRELRSARAWLHKELETDLGRP